MFKHLGLFLAVAALMCSSTSWGQNRPPLNGFVLERIISSPSIVPAPAGNEGVKIVIADLDGGLIRFHREHHYGKSVPCTKDYEFVWSFDRDIYRVAPGGSFELSIEGKSVHVSGECPEHLTVRTSFGGGDGKSMGNLPDNAIPKKILDSLHPQSTKGVITIFADPIANTRGSRESASGKVRVDFPDRLADRHDYVYVGGSFPSHTNISHYWQVIYIYRAIRAGDEIPPRRNVSVDSPRPDRNADSIGTGSGNESGPVLETPPTTRSQTDTTTLVPGPGTGSGTDSGNASTSGSGIPATPNSPTTATFPPVTGGGGAPSSPTESIPRGDRPALPPGANPSAETGRAVIADRRLVEPDQIIHLPISLRNPDGLANLNVDISFDTKVAVVSGQPSKGGAVDDLLFQFNANEPGRVRIGIAGTRGLMRDGILVHIPFRAVGKPGDVTPITPVVTTIASADGQRLLIAEVVGELRIGATGGGVLGDCDGDGVLTAADALCALKMSVGLMEPRMAMDMDLDRQITSSDARLILQAVR